MLPFSLLKSAIGEAMLVELKNGETYNGHLENVDMWMNLKLRDVICTSRDGDKFWQIGECYLRGSAIKYMRIPDNVLEKVKDEIVTKTRGAIRQDHRAQSGAMRGGYAAGRGGAQRGGMRPSASAGGRPTQPQVNPAYRRPTAPGSAGSSMPQRGAKR